MSKFSKEDVSAMRSRLHLRQKERQEEARRIREQAQFDEDIRQSIQLAARKPQTAPFVEAPVQEVTAEAVEAQEEQMSMAAAVLILLGYGCVELVRHLTAADGLMALVLGLLALLLSVVKFR